jgi:hypothetical protein
MNSSRQMLKLISAPDFSYRASISFWDGFYCVEFIHGIKSYKRFFRSYDSALQSFNDSLRKVA